MARVRLEEMGSWDDELPSHEIDRAVPVKIDATGSPLSVGDPIELVDGRLVGEVEPGTYQFIWQPQR
jgi:hypothetical protein